MYESRLKGLVSNLKGTEKRLLLRAKSTGAWLSVCGTKVSGTVLSTTDFWDFYVLTITSLPYNSRATVTGVAQSLE